MSIVIRGFHSLCGLLFKEFLFSFSNGLAGQPVSCLFSCLGFFFLSAHCIGEKEKVRDMNIVN